MRTLAICLALITTLGSALTVQAQEAVAPAAPAAAQPAATGAPAAAAQPAPAAEAAPAAAAPDAATTPVAPEGAAPDDAERQKREADRARIRLLLARARSERAALDQQSGAPTSSADASLPAPQPEPEVVRYGDAGAAIAVGLSLELPWHTEQSFDLFSSTDVGTRFGLWATYDLLALGKSAFLAAGAGFDVENTQSDNLFAGALDTTLTATILYGTAVLRYVPTDWIQPHARLSAGAQLVRSELSFGSSDYLNEGDLPFGSLGAGFTLRSPSRLFESRRGELASLSVGVMVEGGYTLAAPLDMKVDGSGPGDRDIALIESDLDELDRSGPFMRVSLVARFF